MMKLFGDAGPTKGFANLLTEAAYGGVWNRPGLALPDRLLSTIAALGTWPRLVTLRRHIGAALDHGLNAAAVREILLQSGLYAGFSATEETFALLVETIRALEAEGLEELVFAIGTDAKWRLAEDFARQVMPRL